MKKRRNEELTNGQRRILMFRRMCDVLWEVVDAIGPGRNVDDTDDDKPYFGLAIDAESLAMEAEYIIEQLRAEERREGN
jgi:hypothetical protein